MNPKDLIEKRLKLGEDSKAILEKAVTEKRQLTSEEQGRFDTIHADISALKKTLDGIALHEAEEREMAESRGRKTETSTTAGASASEAITAQRKRDRDLALRAWALGPRNVRYVSDEMRAACERIKFDPQTPEFEARALSVGTTDAGGYAVPDEMMRAYWDKQKWFGSVRSLSTRWETTTGAPLPVPTTDDTSNTGEIISEAGSVTTTADPVFGQVILDAYKYSSKAVIVSVEILQDSYIDLAPYLGGKLGTRIARIQNTHFTTGDNSGKPNGIATAATLGKTAAVTTAITFDELIDLQHSVDPAYRANASFMMHDLIAAAVRKLKDTQGRYLWELSTQVGQPDRLLGKPVAINNDMASSFAANQRLVLFGDFQNYLVRDAGGPIFARADELRILNHQVVFLAFQRSDADLIDTTSVKYLRTP